VQRFDLRDAEPLVPTLEDDQARRERGEQRVGEVAHVAQRPDL
jgi:hypothetical protein